MIWDSQSYYQYDSIILLSFKFNYHWLEFAIYIKV